MKKLILLFILSSFSLFAFAGGNVRDVRARGYYRKNENFGRPYRRYNDGPAAQNRLRARSYYREDGTYVRPLYPSRSNSSRPNRYKRPALKIRKQYRSTARAYSKYKLYSSPAVPKEKTVTGSGYNEGRTYIKFPYFSETGGVKAGNYNQPAFKKEQQYSSTVRTYLSSSPRNNFWPKSGYDEDKTYITPLYSSKADEKPSRYPSYKFGQRQQDKSLPVTPAYLNDDEGRATDYSDTESWGDFYRALGIFSAK